MALDIEEQYDRIYRYCFFRLRDRHRAEDVTQETFLRWFASETYRDTGQTLQYLYTVARNLCADEGRRQSAELLPEDLPGSRATRRCPSPCGASWTGCPRRTGSWC